MSTTTLNVTGMTCAHCVSAVSSELQALPGVTAVEVMLKPGETSVVKVIGEAPIDAAAAAAAVDEAGYSVVGGD